MDGFASVTLEGLSPLPLEQLAWGYLLNEKSRHLLIFGAFNERLNAEQIAPEESFFHVLPSFFAAAPVGGEAQWVFIWEAGHVTGLHYGAGESIPSRVEIERLKEDTLAEAFAGRENLLKRLGAHAQAEAAPGLLAQPEGVRGKRDRLDFSFAHYDSAEAAPTRGPGRAPENLNTRWSADLRGSLFCAAEQRRRHATASAALILKVAAVAAIVCIITQIGVVYGQFWIKKTQAKIASQAPDADLVTQRIKLLTQIHQFVDNGLHPFEMLGLINPMRPAKSIYYTKTRAYDNDKLSIDCVATDLPSVEEFQDALNNAGLSVDKNNVNIQSNPLSNPPTYKFTVNLVFSTMPASEDMPPEPPPPELPPLPPEQGVAAASPLDFTNPNGAQATDAQNPAQDPNQGVDAGPPVGSPQTGPNIITAPSAPEPAPAPPLQGTVLLQGGQSVQFQVAPQPAPEPAPEPAPQPAPDAGTQ